MPQQCEWDISVEDLKKLYDDGADFVLRIDGVERGGTGVVGGAAETTTARVYNRVYELKPEASAVDFHVQVANFEFRGGGLRRHWFLGHSASIQRGVGRAVLREGTLFAVGVVVEKHGVVARGHFVDQAGHRLGLGNPPSVL